MQCIESTDIPGGKCQHGNRGMDSGKGSPCELEEGRETGVRRCVRRSASSKERVRWSPLGESGH